MNLNKFYIRLNSFLNILIYLYKFKFIFLIKFKYTIIIKKKKILLFFQIITILFSKYSI